jgi:hypothetical protein
LTGWWAGAAWGAPVYYDYGSGGNVTYEDDSVTVNGQDAGTADQYSQQAQDLAASGAQQLEAPTPDGKEMEWLPLGVFGLSTSKDDKSPTRLFQLAVNKQGVINGSFYNTQTDKTLPVVGAVDRKTQRASWYVGDNKSTVMETGIYNLTQDQASVMVHFGTEKTEEYLLVRLDPPPDDKPKPAGQ